MDEGPVVITLREPEWDLSSSDELARLLEPAQDHNRVVIDLARVTYMDSSCLTKMIVSYKRRAETGLEPAFLVMGNPSIRRLFEIAGLDALWPTFPNLSAALAEGGASEVKTETTAADA